MIFCASPAWFIALCGELQQPAASVLQAASKTAPPPSLVHRTGTRTRFWKLRAAARPHAEDDGKTQIQGNGYTRVCNCALGSLPRAGCRRSPLSTILVLVVDVGGVVSSALVHGLLARGAAGDARLLRR